MTAAGLGLWAAITIAVAGPATSPEYLPLFVAQSEGYFAQEKLEVTLTIERSESDAAQAMARGRADIAATSLDAAYRLGHVKGAPPPLLFGLTAAPPVAILVSPGHKETVRSPRDLRGQPVGLPGVGTPEQAMLATILARAGVRIYHVPLRSFSNRALAGALEQGEVAAAVMADPWVTRLVEDVEVRGAAGGEPRAEKSAVRGAAEGEPRAEKNAVSILVDLRTRSDAARWLGAETVHAALFLRADAAVGEQDLVALAKALLRAVARVSDAPAETLAAGLPASVIGQPGDFALRVAGARQIYLPRGRVTEDMLKASLRQARERVEMPAAVKLPWFRWSPLLRTGPLERATVAGEPPPR
ncbi:MAG: ABC transporter substrate-binding protein [Candidatus Rokubacteria bacterium]|nr:ABC transporter substrate-binding protein [Candidatus Rokubacteria bacterium]